LIESRYEFLFWSEVGRLEEESTTVFPVPLYFLCCPKLYVKEQLPTVQRRLAGLKMKAPYTTSRKRSDSRRIILFSGGL